jgi:hypothetical protein
MAVPKTIGACADRLYKIKELKSELNRQSAVLDKEESEIKEHVINTLPKDEVNGVAGKLGRVTIKKTPKPSVKDWAKLYAYILKKKDFSLLQRKPSEAAIKDRWNEGEKVPGVESFTVVTVSVTKA